MRGHVVPHSKFVEGAIRDLGLRKGVALDMPCGSGRHCILLAEHQLRVVGADLDAATLADTARGVPALTRPYVSLVRLDATRPLPFRDSVFDLVLVVHFPLCNLLESITPLIRPGGYLIVETFGAHGQNWASLPRRGLVREMLGQWFQFLEYNETRVRRAPDRVTLRAIGRKLNERDPALCASCGPSGPSSTNGVRA